MAGKQQITDLRNAHQNERETLDAFLRLDGVPKLLAKRIQNGEYHMIEVNTGVLIAVATRNKDDTTTHGWYRWRVQGIAIGAESSWCHKFNDTHAIAEQLLTDWRRKERKRARRAERQNLAAGFLP